MGTIKSTKDKSLATRASNQAKGNKKAKDSKYQEKNKQENPKYLDRVLNPSKDKEKKKKENTKCTYCHKGWHPKSSCMKKTIDMMAQHLEKNNMLKYL